MCDFVGTLRFIEDETASMSGQVNENNTIEITLETVEPYIVDELPILSIHDQAQAYIGFTHPHTTKRFEILDLIEAKLLNYSYENKFELS